MLPSSPLGKVLTGNPSPPKVALFKFNWNWQSGSGEAKSCQCIFTIWFEQTWILYTQGFIWISLVQITPVLLEIWGIFGKSTDKQTKRMMSDNRWFEKKYLYLKSLPCMEYNSCLHASFPLGVRQDPWGDGCPSLQHQQQALLLDIIVDAVSPDTEPN